MSRKVEVEPTKERAIVKLGGVVIAETDRTVRLREEGLPERLYVPISTLTEGVSLTTGAVRRCPWKGDWHYYAITLGETTLEAAAWEYYAPLEGCAAIAEHIAFDLDKVEVEVEGEAYRPTVA